jgi:hypothetical protein
MSADALPITVLIPETGELPIEVYDQHAALRLAVVDRAGAHLLSDEWDVPGIYLLLDRHDPDGRWGVYVGKAPAGIRSRLGSHLRNKDHWYRAVLVRRDTTFGFNSAQVGWLEGRVYDLMTTAEDARLHNGNRPSDESLPPYDRQMLEMVVLPIQRILRLLGHDPATADDAAAAPRAKRTSRFFGITLTQIIAAGLLAEGAPLVSSNGAWPASATVGPQGSVLYDGTSYPSPSAAACAVKNGPANGWAFWTVDDGTGRTTLATLRARYLKVQPPASDESAGPQATR